MKLQKKQQANCGSQSIRKQNKAMAQRTRKNPKGAGRQTVMTTDVLQKLEDAFTNAFTDEMACLYAGISPATLYNYCQEHPKFLERKEVLKNSPNLAAQKKLVEDAAGSVSGARWWAEHKMPEFMPKSKVEHAGKIEMGDGELTPEARAIGKKYEEELRASIVAGRLNKPKE